MYRWSRYVKSCKQELRKNTADPQPALVYSGNPRAPPHRGVISLQRTIGAISPRMLPPFGGGGSFLGPLLIPHPVLYCVPGVPDKRKSNASPSATVNRRAISRFESNAEWGW